MKKNLIWMCAAILTSGFALTACSVDDVPVANSGDSTDQFEKTTSAIDFEDGNAVFAATSRMSVEVQDNAANGTKVLAFKNANNCQNGYGFAYYDFTDKVQKAAQVAVKFDYFNTNGGRGQMTIGDALVRGTNGAGAGFGRNAYGAKGAIFRIGSDKNNYFVNDVVLGAAADWCSKWLTVEVNIYTIDRKVEWVIKDGEEVLAQSGTTEGEGEEAVFTPGKVDYWQADAMDCTQIDCFGFINNNTSYIDNLSITNVVDPSIKYADAKIIYLDPDGAELKEARTVNGRVGTYVTLLANDKVDIYSADGKYKWVYDSDDAETTPIAENAVIAIKFKAAAKYKYSLNLRFNDGNNTLIKEFAAGEQFAGDKQTVYYQIGYKNPADGKWYVAPKVDSYEGRYFEFPGDATYNKLTGKYTANIMYEPIDSIVYIGEFEDKEAMTLVGEVSTWIGWTDPVFWPGSSNAADYFSRYSAGRAPRLTEGSYFVINDVFATETGKFKIFIYGRNGNASDAETFALYAVDANNVLTKIDVEVPEASTGLMFGITLENVEIPAGCKLAIKNDGKANTIDFDHISICKQP